MVSKQNLLNLPVTLIQILVIAEFHDANASKHHLLAPLGILLKSKNTKMKATNKLYVLNYEFYFVEIISAKKNLSNLNR